MNWRSINLIDTDKDMLLRIDYKNRKEPSYAIGNVDEKGDIFIADECDYPTGYKYLANVHTLHHENIERILYVDPKEILL